MGLLTIIAVTAAGAGGAVVLAPLALGFVGFTAAGIAANSVAAGMMASAATAGSGGVLTGSTVAVLQSAGAAGLAGSTTAVGWCWRSSGMAHRYSSCTYLMIQY
ncbi:interferon alpha-inducible protein 27-like protein 2A [Salvelinus sp. IW2-2015]|uniref:interferon alpha-inducible protein 27-like protein 2A n=1 Tax=Salvelinus sp. IW2-2015 TaxID=2691554 RepID=UPI000CEAAD5C|nr:interferon alpha-inducible protein 27-like protein 2A [Salvelinus alpinus]